MILIGDQLFFVFVAAAFVLVSCEDSEVVTDVVACNLSSPRSPLATFRKHAGMFTGWRQLGRKWMLFCTLFIWNHKSCRINMITGWMLSKCKCQYSAATRNCGYGVFSLLGRVVFPLLSEVVSGVPVVYQSSVLLSLGAPLGCVIQSQLVFTAGCTLHWFFTTWLNCEMTPWPDGIKYELVCTARSYEVN